MLAGASRRHRPVFSGGAVQLFSFFSFSFSFLLGELVGAFLSGEGCFFFVTIFLFFGGQGEGHFLGEVTLFSFSPGGRVTLIWGK